MDLQVRDGWIEVITGCMYAGKTEELLRRVRRIEYARRTVYLFKPKIDTRYSKDEIVSHDSNKAPSILIEKPSEIYQYLEKKPYAIAIDEAQFFDNEIIKVCEDLANLGIRVIVVGLDRDFRGEPFGPMPELLARAEYVTKLNAICYICGAPATRTQRLVNGKPAHYDDPIILVGAKEQYEACCRHCHTVKR
ncbi:MAG TPA: thymidine kinase [Acholeplasmataceae bacterium]|jgi:thymidine kinase|nr:thymidine kinase [Acholeplasmataceae bacterium]